MPQTNTLSQSSRFLTRILNRHLLPSMLISLGTTLNIFFDGIIVGQALGTKSFQAVNLCMPLYLVLCTIGSLIGNGCYLLSSRAEGEGDAEKCRRIYNTSYLYMIVSSLAVTVIGLILGRPLAALLSGSSQSPMFADVLAYAQITLGGAVCKMMLYIPLLYLRLDGRSQWASISTIVMTISNIGLDLLFVCVYEMGVGGAALASVLASLIALMVGICVMLRSKTLKFSLEFEKGIAKDIVTFGAPSAMNNLMSALRVLLINSAILALGTLEQLSIFSVLNNVNEISLFIVDGVPATATPILAIYSTEHSYRGIRIVVRREIKLALIFACVFGVICTAFSSTISNLFGVKDVRLLFPMLCLTSSILLACVSRALVFYYNASGRNVLSLMITVVRLVVFPVTLLYGFLVTGTIIWLFLPLGEALTMLTLLLYLYERHRKKAEQSLILGVPNDGVKGDEMALEFSVLSDDVSICDAAEKISAYCVDNGMVPKTAMRISLALEEVLTLMRQKSLAEKPEETFDVRVFMSDTRTGIRIRCMGIQFNPMTVTDTEEADEYMGVQMIGNLAQSINYSCICGVNNFLIIV